MSEYAVMPLEDYVGACDEIRSRLGSTDKIKSVELRTNISGVYYEGESKGYSNGFRLGKEEGYESGKTDGIDQGKTEVIAALSPSNSQLESTLYGETRGYELTGNINQAINDFNNIRLEFIAQGVIPSIETAGYANNIKDVFESGKSVGKEDGIAEGIEQGRKSQYDELWDGFQNYGQKADYNSAFTQSGYEYIRPKHKIIPTETGTANNTFFYASKLKKIEAEYFDFSQVPYGNSKGTSFNYTFCSCAALEEIEDVGLPPTFCYTYAFAFDNKLHTIAKITVDENTRFDNAFTSCIGLINLIIAGTIGQNGFNVQWSTKLSKDSWISIINALSATTSGLSITGSLESVNTAFETSAGANDGSTSAEWLNLIATKSNWTVNLV